MQSRKNYGKHETQNRPISHSTAIKIFEHDSAFCSGSRRRNRRFISSVDFRKFPLLPTPPPRTTSRNVTSIYGIPIRSIQSHISLSLTQTLLFVRRPRPIGDVTIHFSDEFRVRKFNVDVDASGVPYRRTKGGDVDLTVTAIEK